MFVQSVFDGCVLFQTVQSVFYNVCQCLFIQCLTMSVFDGCLTMIVQLVFVNVVSCVCSSRQSLFDNVQSVFDGCLTMFVQ